MVPFFLYVLPAVAVCAVLITDLRSGRVLRAVLGSAVKGVVSLFAVNAAGMLTGVTIAVNPVTLVGVSLLGVPGTITFLLLDALFR